MAWIKPVTSTCQWFKLYFLVYLININHRTLTNSTLLLPRASSKQRNKHIKNFKEHTSCYVLILTHKIATIQNSLSTKVYNFLRYFISSIRLIQKNITLFKFKYLRKNIRVPNILKTFFLIISKHNRRNTHVGIQYFTFYHYYLI